MINWVSARSTSDIPHKFWVVVSNIFYFHPENWGRWTHFDEHIFQMGWFNHQPVEKCHFSSHLCQAYLDNLWPSSCPRPVPDRPVPRALPIWGGGVFFVNGKWEILRDIREKHLGWWNIMGWQDNFSNFGTWNSFFLKYLLERICELPGRNPSLIRRWCQISAKRTGATIPFFELFLRCTESSWKNPLVPARPQNSTHLRLPGTTKNIQKQRPCR